MRDAQAIIERVKRTSATVQRLDVVVDAAQRGTQPGQHFLARLTESLDPYLREPWIPIRRQGNLLVIERPAGRLYQPGQVVTLLGPIGKPITLRDTVRTLLLIAYDATPASLLMLAEQAIQSKRSVTLVLVGSAQHYALEALPAEIEVLRGDEQGQWPEQKQNFGWADQIIAVAPPPSDLRRYARLVEDVRKVRVEVAEGYLTGLFQPPMPCGIGACQACLIRCPHHEVLACVDGPALDLLSVSLA